MELEDGLLHISMIHWQSIQCFFYFLKECLIHSPFIQGLHTKLLLTLKQRTLCSSEEREQNFQENIQSINILAVASTYWEGANLCSYLKSYLLWRFFWLPWASFFPPNSSSNVSCIDVYRFLSLACENNSLSMDKPKTSKIFCTVTPGKCLCDTRYIGI